MTLDQLEIGQQAVISDLSACSDDMVLRCRALGILQDSKIEVLRRAPGKGPLQIKVLNTLFSIRRSDARSIVVIPA